MKITITSKPVLRGTATQMQVVRVVYDPATGTSRADCVLLDEKGVAIDSFVADADKTQTDAWSDDDAFATVLAANAKLAFVK